MKVSTAVGKVEAPDPSRKPTWTRSTCRYSAVWPQMSHADLVAELRSGNPEAFAWVLKTYEGPLLAFAQERACGAADPEDMVQDAFLRLWDRREALRPDGSIRALLFTTVRNRSVDEYRRTLRRKPSIALPYVPANPPSPLEVLQASELSVQAEEAIEMLPQRRRTVYRMVRENGLSYMETAAFLRLSPQTVANTLSAALSDMRRALLPYLREP